MALWDGFDFDRVIADRVGIDWLDNWTNHSLGNASDATVYLFDCGGSHFSPKFDNKKTRIDE